MSRQHTFALVDCNNFYATCEQLFRPDLRGRPVVVLSNNDGCVVARSREAKKLGIKMGVPLFQIQDLIQQAGVVVFSSNYSLYADLSARVMRTLETLAPQVEIYSIDEAFLDLTGVGAHTPLPTFGQQIRRTVQDWTGITVCVGMAPSKTLAKLANHAAKQYPATGGVVDLTDPARQRRLLALQPVDEVWGVGRRLAKRLNAQGIHTALDLADTPPALIRQQYNVVLERTVRELNGESCLALETIAPHKQQIVCSRSFGQAVTERTTMQSAINSYVSRAAEKLRKEQREAQQMSVFIRTNPFNPDKPQYSQSISGRLVCPSADTRRLNALAQRLLQQIWQPGYAYAKAGILLTDFYDPGQQQTDLFDPEPTPEQNALMALLDQINQKSPGQIGFARAVKQHNWAMKRNRLSPAYTTRWQDLPVVY